MPDEEAFDAHKASSKTATSAKYTNRMALASVWTESTSVHQQDVFFVEQIQHELLVVLGPSIIGQANEHVERSTWRLNLKTVDGGMRSKHLCRCAWTRSR